jgi:hypothetical protein
MGLDISSYAGVVFTVEELLFTLLPKLSRSSFESFKRNALTVLLTQVAEGDNGREYSFGSKNRLIEGFQRIQDPIQLEDWFLRVFEGCADESDGPSSLDYNEELTSLWECLAEAPEFGSLPAQVEFRYSGGRRMNGGDVPCNKVIALFSEFGLFELSQKGQEFANLLGQRTLRIKSYAQISY